MAKRATHGFKVGKVKETGDNQTKVLSLGQWKRQC